MNDGMTPEQWVESRFDWLVDVAIAENGFGTFDVVARVDGSYANRSDAEHFLEYHRREITGMVLRLRRERGWSEHVPLGTRWPFGGDPDVTTGRGSDAA